MEKRGETVKLPAIPKDKIFACMKALREIEVEPPIERGTVILENVVQTGVDIISTKKLLK